MPFSPDRLVRRVEVRVGHPMAPPWRSRAAAHGAAHTCGYAFAPGCTTPERAHVLADTLATEDFHQALAAVQTWTGAFAAVRADNTPDGPAAFAVADAMRSYPLFYGMEGDVLVVTDDPLALARHLGAAPHEAVAAEFLLSGNVLGPDTLARGVFALQAGQVLVVRPDGTTATTRYTTYGGPLDGPSPLDSGDGALPSAPEWDDALVAALDDAFARTVAALDGRPVAVPLSGGLDSRLLVGMLLRHGVRPVLAYTYGRPSSFEAVRSRAVALALGLPWQCVPYSAQAWHRWGQRPDYAAYRQYGSRLVAIEHEQEWPALAALLASGALPPDAAVLPGHAADFNAGSHLPAALLSPDGPYDLFGWILDRYFGQWPYRALGPSGVQAMRRRLCSVLDGWTGAAAPTAARAVHAYEQFGWQERQAKMIANSVRVYEAFGLAWHLPFWDAPLRAFWPAVPLALRFRQRLYRRVAERLLGPVATGIPYAHPAWPRPVALLHEVLDSTHRRYGLFLGPFPEATGAVRRIREFVAPADGAAVNALAGAWAAWPPQRAQINGWLALRQWQDVRRTLGA